MMRRLRQMAACVAGVAFALAACAQQQPQHPPPTSFGPPQMNNMSPGTGMQGFRGTGGSWGPATDSFRPTGIDHLGSGY